MDDGKYMEQKVTVVRTKGGLSLIEWKDENDIPQRAWVKAESILEGSVVVNPESGVPYGLDFTQMVELKTTPEDVNREMRKAGIWTLHDLRANPQGALGALMAAYGGTFSTILKAANRMEKELLGNKP